MYSYVIADDQGMILQVYRTPHRVVPCDAGVSDETHYLDGDGTVQYKRGLDVSPVVEGLTVFFSGLPAGLLVETNGASVQTDGGQLDVVYDTPGNYTIRFSGHPHYLERDLEVAIGDA